VATFELHNRGIEFKLQERFQNLRHISDLEKKAIISTPLNSDDRPLMLSSLGNSYKYRYEQFGDVKYIDSVIVIRQQFKAVASIPRDSTTRRPGREEGH
jgi:hypothetical protein